MNKIFIFGQTLTMKKLQNPFISNFYFPTTLSFFLLFLFFLTVGERANAQFEKGEGRKLHGQNITRDGVFFWRTQGSVEAKLTQWVLKDYPPDSMVNFRVSSIEKNINHLFDFSKTKASLFSVNLYDSDEYFVVLAVGSHLWRTDQGLGYSKLRFFKFYQDDWEDLIVSMLNAARKDNTKPAAKDTIWAYDRKLKEEIATDIDYLTRLGLLSAHFGVRNVLSLDLDVFKEGDTYRRLPYNEHLDVVFNENSFHFYFHETEDLIRLERWSINEAHRFMRSEKSKRAN